jgi:hypothetical protein
VLYLLNRPGNAVSHQDCAGWIDRAIEVVKPHAGQVTLRGDTDFTLTGELDRWDEKGTKFIFGMDAHPKVVELAEGLGQGAWKPLERLPRYEILTRARRKSERVKESIVRFKGYQNKVLTGESVAQIDYQPNKCKKAYRLVIVRKNISVQKGEQVLFDDLRYFFYITNRDDYTGEQIVSLANGRCNQENVIEQLKNGVNAMRMPVDDLLSNWAYMVMTSLAWNLKAWFGLLLPDAVRSREVVRMEFRRFLHSFIRIGSDTPKLASALVDVRIGDGEPICLQESQRIGCDVPSGVFGKVSEGGDERGGGRGAKRGVRGNREKMGDRVSGDWARSGSCALFDPVGSDLQSNADSHDGEECDSTGSVRESARSEEQAVGWGVLGKGIFREYSGAARKRKCDRRVCCAAGRWGELSAVAQRAVGLGIGLKMPRGLPRGSLLSFLEKVAGKHRNASTRTISNTSQRHA